MPTIGLIRVSSDEQARSGLGLEAQRASIAEYALAHGFVVSEIVSEEGVSGAAPMEERVGLLDALSRLKRGDTLLVARRDRLGRDRFLLAWLEKESKVGGWSIVSTSEPSTNGEDPTETLTRHIVDAFAEFERRLIGWRTKRALAARRARGATVGGSAPYGSMWNRENHSLVPDPRGDSAIEVIQKQRDAGWSFQKIADFLNQQGVPAPKGRNWHSATVRSICRRQESVAVVP